MAMIRRLLRDKAAATAIEYGLLIALIALGLVTVLQGMGDEINTTFNTTSSAMADT